MPAGPDGDVDMELICRWAAEVGLVQRAVAIARLAGASAEELYGVAVGEGFTRIELDALLVDPLGGDQ